jgi:hypothetical protein
MDFPRKAAAACRNKGAASHRPRIADRACREASEKPEIIQNGGPSSIIDEPGTSREENTKAGSRLRDAPSMSAMSRMSLPWGPRLVALYLDHGETEKPTSAAVLLVESADSGVPIPRCDDMVDSSGLKR